MKKVYLVNCWYDTSNDCRYLWGHIPINFEKVKESSSNINCIFSDNDYF